VKTPRTAQLPPFFTQVIGSLPRPALVRDLIARRREIPPERYAAVMDEMVLFAIRFQEEAGLDVVSDGEWRRRHYLGEFLDRVGGVEKCRRFEHQGEVKYTSVIVRRMTEREPVFAEEGRFLAQHTDRCAKFALPSPFLIAIRNWHEDYSRDAYPTYQHYMEHLAEILAREAQALVEAGIDIVQIDDPALTYFCDRELMSGEESHDERLRRDWQAHLQLPEAVAAINRVSEGLKAEVHLHCCHSVYKRKSDVCGDYKPLLPWLAKARIDRVNLEFAYAGTGSVDDIAAMPPHLDVGIGVVDVRTEAPQTVEQIEALGAAGTAFLPPQRIALNPDCGFAPDFGEPPTIDEAYEKLRRLTTAAARLRERFAA
jgi:5-methyltetrahydropteroyltriglutamate--homocysteine methyltransferase